MKVSTHVACSRDFPCSDVNNNCYLVPNVNVRPEDIRIVMISEASPPDLSDYLYAKGDPMQLRTTLAAFGDAGIDVSSMKDLLAAGVYVTTALKCGKTSYGVSAASIKNCSLLLEKEIALFPKVEVFMLMGDVAIKGMNYVAKRRTGARIIPPGSTYKIRGGEYRYRGARVFPSYLQAGPAFLVEKSKRRMIAEDIAAAFKSLK